jgi:hypothetical protein
VSPRRARDVPAVLERIRLAVVLVEERQLETVAHLGVLSVRLRLEEVMSRHAVVIGNDLLVVVRKKSIPHAKC